jgi:Tol biopolymer transport system component
MRRRTVGGRYQIQAEIGSGGMGTVYRARDRRTGTIVAVKLLHSHLAQDRHYVERFRREAQIAKSLDSAYIVRVLDVGDHDGQPFIVMEHVPGTTLREVLEARHRFSPREALAVCLQIVQALRHAHSKAVVHRDIKPQNIILTPEGLAKVADFGVAKAEELSTLTLSGSFFGTLQYAAPERFEGEGDIRSDIYSVGIILYQMLTGAVPFAADSALALIRLHSEQPPAPLSQHIPDVPRDVQALVSCCLAKSPAERFQSPDALANAISSLLPAADAKAALARISPPKGRGGLRAAVNRWWAGHRRLAKTALGAGAAAVIVAGLGLGAAWVFHGAGSDSEGPTALDPWAFSWVGSATPSGVVVGETEQCLASAERIAYVGEDGDVWFVDSDGTNAIRVTESGNNSELAFSPDGRKLAYIHKAGVLGHEGVIPEIRIVSRDPTFHEAVVQEPIETWDPYYLASLDNLRWTADGATVLAHVHLGGVAQHVIGAFPLDSALEPYFLGGPDGKPTARPMEPLLRAYQFDVAPISGDVAYVMYRNADPYGYHLNVTDPDGSNDRYVLTPSGMEASYGAPSWSPLRKDIALYVGGSLAVANSDASTYQELAAIPGGTPTDRPRWSPDGKLLAYDDRAAVWLVDADGDGEPRKLADGTHPTWSPDGSQIAYESDGGIWVIPASGGEPRRVGSGSHPEWSPDAAVCGEAAVATQIAYLLGSGEGRYGEPSIYIADALTRESRLLAKNVWFPDQLSWSHDGRQIAFCTPGAGGRLWIIDSDAASALEIDGRCAFPAWSPDGTQLAFASPYHMLVSDIFLVNRDGAGLVNLTNSPADFNIQPSWSPDGERVVFTKQTPDGDGEQASQLFAVVPDGNDARQFAVDALPKSDPQWSPDGQAVAYVVCAEQEGEFCSGALYLADANGENTRKLRDDVIQPRWSPDGDWLAFLYTARQDFEAATPTNPVLTAGGIGELRTLAPDTMEETTVVSLESGVVLSYDWSPDGTQFALALYRDGKTDIFTAKADGTGLTQITTDGLAKYAVAWGPPGAPKELAGEPLDLALPGYGGETATPAATPTATPTAAATSTAPAIDARSVPIESLLRPGAEVQKVLYASLDDTPPEEIVVYSDFTILKDERECGPVPLLEVFAYDTGRDQWSKVFDASEGEGPLASVRLEDYEQGPMCFGYWIHPLELTDFDGDGRHELLARFFLGAGGSGNITDVAVLGFEGAAPEFGTTRLFQAHLSKAQDVVVADQGELWLEQVITSKWEPVGHAAAVLRGVVRYDKNQEEIRIVDQETRLLCTEGTVTTKIDNLLTLSCESHELPGLMDPYPAKLDFLVNEHTRFGPEPAVGSLDDVQIDDYVRVQVAALGLSAGGIAPEWVFIDDSWSVGMATYVSPIAAGVEVVSAP